ncbi:hypothetical protein NL676_000830 [Syzygium grande]|nr:hypothetical protein NL676_000830 [Syzygium grande]
MACTTKCMMQAIADAYKDGFERVGSLVDVGGRTGSAVAEIVRLYPHIKGINFDRPHVIAAAPAHGGVSHVGGDMFEAIPTADAVSMKGILHDWNDEDRVRILKNCRKALSEKNGMVIVADIVLRPDGDGLFDEARIGLDLMMMAQTGGKERSEPEWKKIMEKGGFPRYNIIRTASLSIIEAFPLWLSYVLRLRSQKDFIKILRNCSIALRNKDGKGIIEAAFLLRPEQSAAV